MRASILSTLAALAALTAAALWSDGDATLAATHRPTIAGGDPSEAVTAAPPRRAIAAGPQVGAIAPSARTLLAAAPRADSPRSQGAVTPTRTVRLLVVNGADGSPIPRCEVFFGDALPSTDNRAIQFRTPAYDPRPDLEQHGQRTTTDQHGVATLSLSLEKRWVSAKTATLSGSQELPKGLVTHPDGPPLRLALQPNQRVAVRTVDGAGQPLGGIPLALYRTPGSPVPEYLGTTHVDHATLLVPISDGGAVVVVDLPGLRQRTYDLRKSQQSQTSDSRPFDIVVGAHGTFVVEVVDEFQRPVADAIVTIERIDPVHPARVGEPVTPQPFLAQQGVTDHAGRVRFDSVGVASLYGVRVIAGSARFQRTVRGPQTQSAIAEVQLVRPRALAVVEAALTDRAGAPLAEQPVRLSYVAGGRPGSVNSTSNDQGIVRFELAQAAAGQHIDHAQIDLLAANNTLTGATAPVALDAFEPREQWLGTVRLVETPLVVSGRSSLPTSICVAYRLEQFEPTTGQWVPSVADFTQGRDGRFTYRSHQREGSGLYRLAPTNAHPDAAPTNAHPDAVPTTAHPAAAATPRALEFSVGTTDIIIARTPPQ